MSTSFISIDPDKKHRINHLSGFKEIIIKSIENLPSNDDELTIAFYDSNNKSTIDVKLEVGTMPIPSSCLKIVITNYSEEVIKISYEMVPFIDLKFNSPRR